MEWKLATEGFTVAEDEHIEGGTIVYEGPYGVKAPAGMRHTYPRGRRAHAVRQAGRRAVD